MVFKNIYFIILIKFLKLVFKKNIKIYQKKICLKFYLQFRISKMFYRYYITQSVSICTIQSY